jgi:hypothetical protein
VTGKKKKKKRRRRNEEVEEEEVEEEEEEEKEEEEGRRRTGATTDKRGRNKERAANRLRLSEEREKAIGKAMETTRKQNSVRRAEEGPGT